MKSLKKGSAETDPSLGERANPGGRASGSGRPPEVRQPRPPSHSPGRDRKWVGPIPAGHRRPQAPAPVHRRPQAPDQKKKKQKKNKGLKKKEHQQQWLRDFGRHRGRDTGRYRR